MPIRFILFLVAQGVSQFGSAASTIGLATLLAVHGAPATELALILALPALPASLVAPFIGAAVERVSLRPFMVVANVFLGLIALGVAWAMSLGPQQHQLATLLILFFCRELGRLAFAAGYARAFGALSPATTGRPVLLADLSAQAGSALGAAVGGLVALQGGNEVFLIDAATFVVAGLLTLCLPLPGSLPRRTGSHRRLIRDTKVAALYLWRNPRVMRMVGAYCVISLPWAAWDVSGAYLFNAVGSPAAAGTANAAGQIGKMLTGVWLLGLRADFSANKVLLAALVLAGTGVAAGAVGLTGPHASAVVALVLLRTAFGAAVYLGGSGAYTLVVLDAPDGLRARLATLVGSVCTGLVAGSVRLGVGALNDAAGPAVAFLASGLLCTGLSLVLLRLEFLAQLRVALQVSLACRLYWAHHAAGLELPADRLLLARLVLVQP